MEKPDLPSLDSTAKTSSTSSFIGKEFSRESIAKAIYSTSRTTATPTLMPQMMSSFSEKIKTFSKTIKTVPENIKMFYEKIKTSEKRFWIQY